MNYDLAKRLRDAGFPQGDSFEKVISHGTAMAYLRESKPNDELLEKYEDALLKLREMYEDDKEWVYVPTLSELITACGKPFALKIHENEEEWFAADDTEGFACNAGYGSTPEEAVANLWLALHEKTA